MIGDVLASTIVCEHLKIHFPTAEVHYLVDEHTTGVVDGNPFVDELLLFKKDYRKSKLLFYRFLKSIKKQRYDVTIDLLCKTESTIISWFSRAPIRISYPKWYSKFIYTHTFKHSQKKPSALGMAIDNRLLLLQPLIHELNQPQIAPKLYLSDDEVSKAEQILRKNEITGDKPLLMLGILGSSPLKTYPLPYMAHLLDQIIEKYDFDCIINYIPEQKPEVEQLLSLCAEKTKEAINSHVCGSSLREFLALLNHCDAYFGNEGGASHMAKALNKPNFSIFAPWISKNAWMTYQDNSANRAVHLEDYHPNAVSFSSKKERKEKIPQNYQLFKPALFEEKLFGFFNDEVISHQ